MTPAAQRDLKRLDPHIRKRVGRDLLRLEEDPRPRGAERLEAHAKLYRIYVGPGRVYRAIYQIQDEVLLVLVVRVEHRKEVYRRLQ